MATDAGPEPGAQVDAGQVWRAIGQVEGRLSGLEDGQQGTRDEIRELRAEVRSEMRDIHRRIDRLLYLGIAATLAVLGTVIVSQVFS